MTTLRAEPETPAPSRPGPKIRVAYRDGAGRMHFDWPADRIADAVADRDGILWVDIEDSAGEGNGGVEALLRDVFGFHPLAIEDALKETHVPKVDDWDHYLYLVFHAIEFCPETHGIRLHELDFFLGPNFLVSYHLGPLGFIEQHRRNIERDPVNRLRHGADHLLYHLLDRCVAEYLPALEKLDDAIDDAQDEVFRRPTPRTLKAIFRVKRAAIRLHRVLGPLREVLNRLARDDYEPIRHENRIYFRDVYDHIVRTLDITESLRDLIAGALDTYLSAIANRTNDIMKTLTLVSVMFLPLSFLVGFWGMNFFGETLAFQAALPRRTLFVATCLVMMTTPWAIWLWSRRRGWF